MHHHRRWVHATEPSRSLHAALPTHAAPHRIPSMQRPLSARLHACTIDVMPLSRLGWSIPATGPAPAPYRPGYRPGACSGYRPGPCSVSIYCCIMQIRRKSVACPHHLSSASRLARLPPVPPAASVACPRRIRRPPPRRICSLSPPAFLVLLPISPPPLPSAVATLVFQRPPDPLLFPPEGRRLSLHSTPSVSL